MRSFLTARLIAAVLLVFVIATLGSSAKAQDWASKTRAKSLGFDDEERS